VKKNSQTSTVYWRVGVALVVIALVAFAVLITYDAPAGAQTATSETTAQQTRVTVLEADPQEEQEAQRPAPTSDGLTIVPDDELSPMAKSCLATLYERLRASGVPVLSVSTRVAWEGDAQVVRENTDAADELPVVVVRIATASVSDSDYLFTTQQIDRQTAFMVTAGAPIRILGIVTVDGDTKQEVSFSIRVVSDSGIAPEWNEPARMEYANAEASAKSAATDACSKAGVDLVSFGFGEDDFGRTLELNVALGTGDSGNPGALMDALQSSLSGLNAKNGAKIATVMVRVEDSAGSPVARATMDFGVISAFWLAPQYRGQTDMKPGIFQ
jgi:hypothetical protein